MISVIGMLSHPRFSRESGVAVGIVCILSLASLFGSIGLIFEEPPDGDGYLPALGAGEVASLAFADGIELYLAESFSLPLDKVEVIVEGFDIEAMRAEKITATLAGVAAVSDLRAVRACLDEAFLAEGGKCEVVIYPYEG